MQNKGAIRMFAILLALICVYQLMFTFKASQVEKAAKTFAKGDKQKEQMYLDSMSSEVVYNLLGIRKYTFKEVKALELGLGLDLQGGMNVTWKFRWLTWSGHCRTSAKIQRLFKPSRWQKKSRKPARMTS